jgi:hypothetical protein
MISHGKKKRRETASSRAVMQLVEGRGSYPLLGLVRALSVETRGKTAKRPSG